MPNLFPENISTLGANDKLSVGGLNLCLQHPRRPLSVTSPRGRGPRLETPRHTPPIDVIDKGNVDGGDNTGYSSPSNGDDGLSRHTDADLQFQNLTFVPPDGQPPAPGLQLSSLPTLSSLARV